MDHSHIEQSISWNQSALVVATVWGMGLLAACVSSLFDSAPAPTTAQVPAATVVAPAQPAPEVPTQLAARS